MKDFWKKIGLFAAVALSVVSCLKENETVTYPQCAINSFTIGTITTTFYTKTKDGLNDSTYTRVVDGSNIAFNIDQIGGKIESVDSIVNWADISRVVPTITYTGYIFCKQRDWDDFYYFSSGTDSVDFTRDVEFLVISTNGDNSKRYKAKLNKAVLSSDSLYWADMSATNLTLDGAHRTLSLASVIYVFAENGGTPTVTTLDVSADGKWTTPTALTGCAGTLDYRSVVLFKNQFYALSTDGILYTSTQAQKGAEWTKASDQTFSRLLCADENYLYAYDGTQILMSDDLTTWTANGSADLDKLPVNPLAYASYTTQTNHNLQNVVMLGLTDPVGDNAATWYKISSADKDLNQNWGFIPAASDNTNSLPSMENLTMVRFNGMLMAFGGKNAQSGDAADAYRFIYSSRDNGLSWHKYTNNVMLPQELNKAPEKPATGIVIGDQMWLLQSGGKVWRGKIGSTK